MLGRLPLAMLVSRRAGMMKVGTARNMPTSEVMSISSTTFGLVSSR